MKKLLLLIALSLCSLTMFAQLPVSFGIHGGVSTNEIKVKGFTESLKSENRLGWMIGVFGRLEIKKWYIEPALNYTVRKANLSGTYDHDSYDNDLKCKSFDIPVMFGFKFLNLSVVNARIFAGPEFSFGSDVKLSEIDSDEIKGHDMNTNGRVGLGVDILKFTFDADYMFGISKIGQNIKAPKAWNFTIGYKFI